MFADQIIYEDNHVIVINKRASDIVQGDKTGDRTLPDEIKDYLKDQHSPEDDYSSNLWFQSWLNYHKQNEVLDWHDHPFPFHGYISIDPKDSTTEFRNYSIKNKIGNIYIGQGHRQHRVVVDTPYNGTRITLGYDIATVKTIEMGKTSNVNRFNLGFIPIIIER